METDELQILQSQAYINGYRAGYWDGLAAQNAPVPDILFLPVEALGLTARPRNCLLAYGCRRVADILALPEETICRMRNLGRKSAGEIALALHRQGLWGSAWDSRLPAATQL